MVTLSDLYKVLNIVLAGRVFFTSQSIERLTMQANLASYSLWT